MRPFYLKSQRMDLRASRPDVQMKSNLPIHNPIARVHNVLLMFALTSQACQVSAPLELCLPPQSCSSLQLGFKIRSISSHPYHVFGYIPISTFVKCLMELNCRPPTWDGPDDEGPSFVSFRFRFACFARAQIGDYWLMSLTGISSAKPRRDIPRKILRKS